jgi:hypothetical protein
LLRSGVRRGSPAVVGAGGLLVAASGARLVAFRIAVMGLLPSVPWIALALLRQPRASANTLSRRVADRVEPFRKLAAATYGVV